jgi:xylulokinase
MVKIGVPTAPEVEDFLPRNIERFAGGAAWTRGGLCTRIVSDATGRAQDLPEQTIGAAYGDALLAARAVGLAQPETDWSTISSTVEPDPENREIYDELYRVYRDLYPATREMSHALADMQRGGGDVVTWGRESVVR